MRLGAGVPGLCEPRGKGGGRQGLQKWPRSSSCLSDLPGRASGPSASSHPLLGQTLCPPVGRWRRRRGGPRVVVRSLRAARKQPCHPASPGAGPQGPALWVGIPFPPGARGSAPSTQLPLLPADLQIHAPWGQRTALPQVTAGRGHPLSERREARRRSRRGGHQLPQVSQAPSASDLAQTSPTLSPATPRANRASGTPRAATPPPRPSFCSRLLGSAAPPPPAPSAATWPRHPTPLRTTPSPRRPPGASRYPPPPTPARPTAEVAQRGPQPRITAVGGGVRLLPGVPSAPTPRPPAAGGARPPRNARWAGARAGAGAGARPGAGPAATRRGRRCALRRIVPPPRAARSSQAAVTCPGPGRYVGVRAPSSLPRPTLARAERPMVAQGSAGPRRPGRCAGMRCGAAGKVPDSVRPAALRLITWSEGFPQGRLPGAKGPRSVASSRKRPRGLLPSPPLPRPADPQSLPLSMSPEGVALLGEDAPDPRQPRGQQELGARADPGVGVCPHRVGRTAEPQLVREAATAGKARGKGLWNRQVAGGPALPFLRGAPLDFLLLGWGAPPWLRAGPAPPPPRGPWAGPPL